MSGLKTHILKLIANLNLQVYDKTRNFIDVHLAQDGHQTQKTYYAFTCGYKEALADISDEIKNIEMANVCKAGMYFLRSRQVGSSEWLFVPVNGATGDEGQKIPHLMTAVEMNEKLERLRKCDLFANPPMIYEVVTMLPLVLDKTRVVLD